jgi:hypothetical protein
LLSLRHSRGEVMARIIVYIAKRRMGAWPETAHASANVKNSGRHSDLISSTESKVIKVKEINFYLRTRLTLSYYI